MDAFAKESIQDIFSKKWYPIIPAARQRATIAKPATKLRPSRAKNAALGSNGSVRRSNIFSPGLCFFHQLVADDVKMSLLP